MINFFTEGVDFDREDYNYLKEWLASIVGKYNYVVKNINYIFCKDDYLLDINKRYLNNDYYTDIIAFPYIDKRDISADIYISLERVKKNAMELNYDFELEFLRILVHGILHMVGFNDKTEKELNRMRNEEDKLINLYKDKYA